MTDLFTGVVRGIHNCCEVGGKLELLDKIYSAYGMVAACYYITVLAGSTSGSDQVDNNAFLKGTLMMEMIYRLVFTLRMGCCNLVQPEKGIYYQRTPKNKAEPSKCVSRFGQLVNLFGFASVVVVGLGLTSKPNLFESALETVAALHISRFILYLERSRRPSDGWPCTPPLFCKQRRYRTSTNITNPLTSTRHV